MRGTKSEIPAAQRARETNGVSRGFPSTAPELKGSKKPEIRSHLKINKQKAENELKTKSNRTLQIHSLFNNRLNKPPDSPNQ